MGDLSPQDLVVIIPTRGRSEVLDRTLEALEHQSVAGFEVVVVVDGEDQPPPGHRAGVRVVHQAHAGPGSARNRGAGSSDRPLLLFLGADMVPTPRLVECHLERHRREADDRVAVLGHVRWHEEVAANPLNRWLDWSSTQFDYDALVNESAAGATEAGFGRFYSCNVSLKRRLFDAAGGFDPAFTYYYEDLDLGYRLDRAGMVLRYEPEAVVEHLHPYDWPAIVRRFEGIAVGERAMVEKHPWFVPFYQRRVLAAGATPPVWQGWPRIADRLDLAPVRRLADRWYHQQLEHPFLDAWDDGRDLAELEEYLGPDFDRSILEGHVAAVESEEMEALDETTFYRTSNAYLYDLTVFAMSGTKAPYHRMIRRLVSPGSKLLDYGCGIGADGLRLLEQGYEVSFADFDNPSVAFLRWRLRRRRLDAGVHDVEGDLPGGADLVYCFDVVEHVEDPEAFLERLEGLAAVVVVNFLEPMPDDTHVHRPLDIPALLDRCERRGLLRYELHHGRSHVVAYMGTGVDARRLGDARSRLWRRFGGRRRATALLSWSETQLGGTAARISSVLRCSP